MHDGHKIKLLKDSKNTADCLDLFSSVAAEVLNGVDAYDITPSAFSSLALVFFVPSSRSRHCKTILDWMSLHR